MTASVPSSEQYQPRDGSTRGDRSSMMAAQQQSPQLPTGLAGVARRDYETTNVARVQSQTQHRRSSSRDRAGHNHTAATSARGDGQPARSGSRTQHPQRYTSSETQRTPTSAASRPAPSQVPSRPPVHDGQAVPVKRRTQVEAQTGIWTLGKTIGAGSMGKVKIAKNVETGEQVWIREELLSNGF